MSFFGGLGSGLSQGISSGVHLMGAIHQAKLWGAQDDAANAYASAQSSGNETSAFDQGGTTLDQNGEMVPVAGGSSSSRGAALPAISPSRTEAPRQALPQQTSYDDKPADLSTVKHPTYKPPADTTQDSRELAAGAIDTGRADRRTPEQNVTDAAGPLGQKQAVEPAPAATQQTSPTGSPVGQTAPLAAAGPYQGGARGADPTGVPDPAPTSPTPARAAAIDDGRASGASAAVDTVLRRQRAAAISPTPNVGGDGSSESPPAPPAPPRHRPPAVMFRPPEQALVIPGTAASPDVKPGLQFQDWDRRPGVAQSPAPPAAQSPAPPAAQSPAAPGAQSPPPSPAQAAPPPAPAAQPAPDMEAQRTLGSRILSAINPVSSAHAEPASPVASSPPAQGALAQAPEGGAALAPAQAVSPSGATPSTTVGSAAKSNAPIEKGMPPAAKVELPQMDKPIVPNQATPTVQSEPAESREARHPQVNPQSLLWLDKNRPEDAGLVRQIADKHGISPERLAAHWWMESRLKRSSPDSNQDARGVMQVLDGTQREVDPRMELNHGDYRQSLELGARYIRKLDDSFGRDTFSSVAAYHAGPGGADDIARGNADRHPKTMDYVTHPVFFGGESFKPSDFTTSARIDVGQASQAAETNGPNGFLHYIANTEPKNMTLGAKWQAVENAFVRSEILRGGSIQEIKAAQDWVTQQAQKGANENLINAHKSMVLGDNYTAAQYLAKAHAFFPDGTVGRFGVDQKGNLWASRVDEGDQSKALGGPQMITLDKVQMMLAQSRDPNTYLKLVQSEQKVASELKLAAAHSNYYQQNTQTRGDRLLEQKREFDLRHEEQVNQHDTTNALKAQQAFQAEEKARQAAQTRRTAIDGEIGEYYGPKAIDTGDGAKLTPEQRGSASMLHRSLRENSGVTAPEASRLATGVATGSHVLRPIHAADGSIKFGIYSKASTGAGPEALVDPDVGEALAGRLQPMAQQAVRNAGLNRATSALPGRNEMPVPRTTPVGSMPMPAPPTSQALH